MIPLGIMSCNPYRANSFDESDTLDPQLCKINIGICIAYEEKRKKNNINPLQIKNYKTRQMSYRLNLFLNFSPPPQTFFS